VLEHLLSSSLPVGSLSHDQLVAAMPFATRSFAATG